MTIDWAKAIKERKRIRLFYAPGERLIEPHAYGRSSDGNLLVRAFQIEGASDSHEHHDWKLFRVDRMGQSNPDGGFTEPRNGYKREDKAMKGGIIAQL
tara:strand:- start:1353 stop:1646 length:294 start_codon:yes stop_codon:yes gene_type:complete